MKKSLTKVLIFAIVISMLCCGLCFADTSDYINILEFNSAIDAPAYNGKYTKDIKTTPRYNYTVSFGPKALPEEYSNAGYEIQAAFIGVGPNGYTVYKEYKYQNKYTISVNLSAIGQYYFSMELYLVKDGYRVYTLTRDLSFIIDKGSCNHSWDLKLDTATCTSEGTAYYICSICGECKEEKSPIHEHKLKLVSDTATCNQNGIITELCTVCGKIVTKDSPAKGHSYAGGSSTDEPEIPDEEPTGTVNATGEGSEVCTVCGHVKGEEDTPVLAECQHDWNVCEGTVPSTCTTEGNIVLECSKCLKKVDVTLQKSVHTTGEWIADVKHTCTQEGHYHLECSTCSETVLEKKVPVGHEWSSASVSVLPTCTTDGLVKRYCLNCSSSIELAIPHGHHSIVFAEAAEGSCLTEKSTDHYVCGICGALFSDAEGNNPLTHDDVFMGLDKNNHLGGEQKYDGRCHYTLCACGEHLNEEKHTFSNGVCTVCGYVQGTLPEGTLLDDIITGFCDTLGIAEMNLLAILVIIALILFISTVVVVVVFIIKRKKQGPVSDEPDDLNSTNNGNFVFGELSENDILSVQSIGDNLGGETTSDPAENADQIDAQYVEYQDAVLIDWDSFDPMEPIQKQDGQIEDEIENIDSFEDLLKDYDTIKLD